MRGSWKHGDPAHFDSYLQFDLYRVNGHDFVLKDKRKKQNIKMQFHCAYILGKETKMQAGTLR